LRKEFVPSLLVIDDEPLILDTLRIALATPGVEMITAGSAAEGWQRFEQQRPDVVLLDVRLPDRSGLELFQQMHRLDPKVPVVLMTAHGTSATAIEAMRLGAYEYLIKPLDPDALAELIERGLETRRLMSVPALVADDEGTDASADVLIGRCPAMQAVYRSIGRVAQQNVTVLILGESGTGKEVVARAIYHYGPRAEQPFLAMNCAAIAETLLESELFGHERGAFTGADRRRIGKFEQCNGGTLFLDEIGDMTPLTQTKVLRLLQEQTFERVGGTETIQTDVRVLAATNRNLDALMAAGRFRADLFYRLNVYTIQLPPLRERGEDLPLLVNHFLRKFNRELGKDVTHVAPEVMSQLLAYPWPGNVRELQSVLKHALIQATGPVLVPDFLPLQFRSAVSDVPATAPASPTFDVTSFVQELLAAGSTDLHGEVTRAAERQLFTQVLAHTGGNQTQAARLLGITRATLRTKLAQLEMSVERTAAPEDESAAE
jgi:two-component system nitrogen regulation response regulator GlnG